MKHTPNVEVGRTVSPLVSPGAHDAGSSPPAHHGSGQRQTAMKISDVLRTFVSLVIVVACTCVFSGLALGLGTTIPFSVPPFTFNPATFEVQFKTTLIGALVVGPAVGVMATVVNLVFHQLSRPRTIGTGNFGTRPINIWVYALPSIFAIPLGLAMLPRLATETFEPLQALAMSAIRLGAPCVVISCWC